MHCTRENWSASLLTCCLLSTADANLVVPNNILPRAVSVVICLVSSRLSIPGNLHSFPFRYHFVRHVCLLVLFVVAIYLRMSNLDARLYVATRCGSFFFLDEFVSLRRESSTTLPLLCPLRVCPLLFFHQ